MSERKQKQTVEVDAVLAKAQADAKIAAAKQKQEDLKAYDHRVHKMSFRQLRGELRREARSPRDTCLLTSAWASVLSTVLENTQTPENPFAKLQAYPRCLVSSS